MATPPPVRSIGGAGIAIAALGTYLGFRMFADKQSDNHAIAEKSHDIFVKDGEYRLMHELNGGHSGYKTLEGWAHVDHYWGKFGIFGWKTLLHNIQTKLGLLWDNVTSPEGLVVIAGAHVIHPKAYKLVTTPVKWAWNYGLKPLGTFIKDRFSSGNILRGIKKGVEFLGKNLFGTLPGLFLLGAAAVVGWRYSRVKHGVEQDQAFAQVTRGIPKQYLG